VFEKLDWFVRKWLIRKWPGPDFTCHLIGEFLFQLSKMSKKNFMACQQRNKKARNKPNAQFWKHSLFKWQ
jgi:hypothetical protein